MTKISFTWSTRREGNNGFVLEKPEHGPGVEFGPMPPHIVPAFVEARRRYIAMRASEEGASYVEDDFEFLIDPRMSVPPSGPGSNGGLQ